MSRRVLVGLSGGVDSALSAALLVEMGYDVTGAFMKNWSGTVASPELDPTVCGPGCGWQQERDDALRVATHLGIPFKTFDFEVDYRREVMETMFEEYARGRTPNPDILCNREVKFKRFVEAADELGCEYVATGHYAQVKGSQLLRAVDENKDQTYFLYAIPRTVLTRTLFPVGYLTKPEVRREAMARGLPVASKKDSTGICFVGDVEMRTFLQARLQKQPGAIVTSDGRVVGQHEGLSFYTIGQREGLRISLGTPTYVLAKRFETNELVVGSGVHPLLFGSEVIVDRLNWLVDAPRVPLRCLVRARHRQPLQAAEVIPASDGITARVVFDRPQRALTPGQSVVWYREDGVVIGGGVIDEVVQGT